jgi:hypothetical protein
MLLKRKENTSITDIMNSERQEEINKIKACKIFTFKLHTIYDKNLCNFYKLNKENDEDLEINMRNSA